MVHFVWAALQPNRNKIKTFFRQLVQEGWIFFKELSKIKLNRTRNPDSLPTRCELRSQYAVVVNVWNYGLLVSRLQFLSYTWRVRVCNHNRFTLMTTQKYRRNFYMGWLVLLLYRCTSVFSGTIDNSTLDNTKQKWTHRRDVLCYVCLTLCMCTDAQAT